MRNTRRRKPVRYIEGEGWQVFYDLQSEWINCDSEEDAVLIAEAESLCDEVLAGRKGGEAVTIRLDAMAEAVNRKIGRGILVRYIQHAARRTRDRLA